MSPEQLRKDYDRLASAYASLQKESRILVEELAGKHASAIDVATITERPGGIKTIESILTNLSARGKYEGHIALTEIKDIAGVRVTCHCEDDAEHMVILLEGELRQRYANVTREDKGGDANAGKSRPPYRAIHITFSKNLEDGTVIFCEIQIRTVMADAWAVQDRKYVYGREVEGDTHEITDAVSEVMHACEKLWSLVKKKTRTTSSTDTLTAIDVIRKKAVASLGISKTLEGNPELEKWFKQQDSIAMQGLAKLGISTYMEIKFTPPDIGLNITQDKLREAAKNSTIRTFGWPIGIFMEQKEEFMPKVDSSGIHAEIAIKGPDWFGGERISYDFWSLNKKGAFYQKSSLFELERKPEAIFFDTRIVRITETLLYLRNLYSLFGVPENAKVLVSITHGGLRGKTLEAASEVRSLFGGYIIDSNVVGTKEYLTITDVNSRVVELVERFTSELFIHFNFFKLDKRVLSQIVLNFVEGKIR